MHVLHVPSFFKVNSVGTIHKLIGSLIYSFYNSSSICLWSSCSVFSLSLSLSLSLFQNFCSHWDLNLEPPTNPPIPLPLELGLKGKVLHVLLETFYNVEGLVG